MVFDGGTLFHCVLCDVLFCGSYSGTEVSLLGINKVS